MLEPLHGMICQRKTRGSVKGITPRRAYLIGMRLNRNLIERLACFKSNCVMFVSVCVVRNGGYFAHRFNKERTIEKEQLLTNLFDNFRFFH